MPLREFVAIAAACALLGSVALAQPAAPASAAPTGPRLLTPAEARDRGSVPGDLRPADPVVPQIRIPLGKALAPGSRRIQPANAPAAAGGVDDSVARCEARSSKAARAACLRALRQLPTKP